MRRRTWHQRWQEQGGGRELLRLAWPLILSNSFWTLQITLLDISYGALASGIAATAATLLVRAIAR